MFISMISTLWAPTVDYGCRFGHHFRRHASDSSQQLFYRFLLNQAIAFLTNPFRRGFPRSIGRIQRYHAVGGVNGTTMVVMFVG
jgi:hypothetical protein